jgi:hypothetical protein
MNRWVVGPQSVPDTEVKPSPEGSNASTVKDLVHDAFEEHKIPAHGYAGFRFPTRLQNSRPIPGYVSRKPHWIA